MFLHLSALNCSAFFHDNMLVRRVILPKAYGIPLMYDSEHRCSTEFDDCERKLHQYVNLTMWEQRDRIRRFATPIAHLA